jgi:hypothetical protein
VCPSNKTNSLWRLRGENDVDVFSMEESSFSNALACMVNNNNQQSASKQELENNMIKTDKERHNQCLGSNNPITSYFM